MLDETQRSVLNLMGLHWEEFYRVYSENGLCKAELRSDTSVVLTAETPRELGRLLQEDRASRHTSPEVRWIETNSGPPYKIRT